MAVYTRGSRPVFYRWTYIHTEQLKVRVGLGHSSHRPNDMLKRAVEIYSEINLAGRELVVFVPKVGVSFVWVE